MLRLRQAVGTGWADHSHSCRLTATAAVRPPDPILGSVEARDSCHACNTALGLVQGGSNTATTERPYVLRIRTCITTTERPCVLRIRTGTTTTERPYVLRVRT
jgi:hypothetical protein